MCCGMSRASYRRWRPVSPRAPVQTPANWNFAPFTVGTDPDYPVSAPLYYTPGHPTEYAKDSTYSSVAFNHLSLVFRNITGQEPSAYLRQALLDPIGVGRMAYKTTAGMGDYVWAAAGNGLSSARDFARIGYLMLHEGRWDGTRDLSARRGFANSPARPPTRTSAPMSTVVGVPSIRSTCIAPRGPGSTGHWWYLRSTWS